MERIVEIIISDIIYKEGYNGEKSQGYKIKCNTEYVKKYDDLYVGYINDVFKDNFGDNIIDYEYEIKEIN